MHSSQPSRADNAVWRGPDWCSPAGANQLAERLEAYWRERGYDIQLAIRYEGGTACVRSNLINGSPPADCRRSTPSRT